MCALGGYATANVWGDIWETARRHGEVAHILLVPVVVAVLTWVRRERLRHCQPVATWVGPILVVGGWLGSLVGEPLEYKVLAHVGAVAILIGCVLSMTGVEVLRRFLPAFAAVLLLIPAPWVVHETLTAPFQAFVAELSLTAYGMVGIHAHLEGDRLVVGNMAVPLVAAAGAPGLKAIFLVAYGFSFAQPLRSWVRGLLLASTPVFAAVLQTLGTLLVVWFAQGREAIGVVALTTLAGLVLLPVALGLMVLLVRLLGWAAVPVRDYSLAEEG